LMFLNIEKTHFLQFQTKELPEDWFKHYFSKWIDY
jgi:hypothetical protein